MQYVCDAAALLAIETDYENSGEIFNRFTDLVGDGDLTYPDEVVAELGRIAKDEAPHVWARAAKKERLQGAASYETLRWVTNNVRELVDSSAEHESSGPAVLALAVELREAHADIRVVTEDSDDKPTRISLQTACTRLEVPWVTLEACLDECFDS